MLVSRNFILHPDRWNLQAGSSLGIRTIGRPVQTTGGTLPFQNGVNLTAMLVCTGRFRFYFISLVPLSF